MSNYDEQFESQLAVYRRRRRLLVANNIHFKAARADFKNVCRAKLSKPDTVKFFWRAANMPHNTHRGWVMLGFELRADCKRAEEELKNFEFRGRFIRIQRASRVAYAPLQRTTQSADASATATETANTALDTTPAAAAAPAATDGLDTDGSWESHLRWYYQMAKRDDQ